MAVELVPSRTAVRRGEDTMALNNHGPATIGWGAHHSLQRLVNDDWVEIGDQTATTLEARILQPGDRAEWTDKIDHNPGRYRVRTHITTEHGPLVLAAELDVLPD